MSKTEWVSSAKTDIGTVRKVNEDAFFDNPKQMLWCVADGMGGHSKGDLASRTITEALHTLAASKNPISTKQISETLHRVNAQIWALGQSQHCVIGSTVVVLLIDHQHAHCIWAGDSRVYRLRNRQLSCLTRDHSHVQDLLDAGLIGDEEAEKHPQANVITRAIGAANTIELSVLSVDLLAKDQFLLCSDGLNKVINDDELKQVLLNNECKNMASVLVDAALSRQAKDNITCIYVYNQLRKGKSHLASVPQDNMLDSTLPLSF